jgi:hypothetical protein
MQDISEDDVLITNKFGFFHRCRDYVPFFVCVDCIRASVRNKEYISIKENEVFQKLFGICGCPDKLPQRSIIYGWLMQLLNEKERQKIKDNERLLGCGHTHITQPFVTKIQCCNRLFCSKCCWTHNEIECPSEKTETSKSYLNTVSFAILSFFWNISRCPNCKLPIQKNGGCNSVICTSCSYTFCWICKGSLTYNDVFNNKKRCGKICRRIRMLDQWFSENFGYILFFISFFVMFVFIGCKMMGA